MLRRMMTALPLAMMAFPAAAETTPDMLLGAWTTPLAEQPAPGGRASAFVRERLVFGETRNTIEIEAFADSEGLEPIFTYASFGPYRTPGPSEAVPGALLLDAENETSMVTIFQNIPALWAILNLASCPLEIGSAVEISDCVAGPPLNAANCVELDLVAVTAAGLRLGARDTNRCLERPSALGETLYLRQHP